MQAQERELSMLGIAEACSFLLGTDSSSTGSGGCEIVCVYVHRRTFDDLQLSCIDFTAAAAAVAEQAQVG